MVDELRNQLKSQDLSNLLASSVANVGGSVFPDEPAAVDIEVFSSIIEAWQKVHVPSYGSPIAGSATIVSVDGSETILTPSTNQVARIQQLNLTNSGGAAPIAVTIKTGTAVLFSGDIGPSTTLSLASAVTGLLPVYIDKVIPLSVAVTGGAAPDLTTECVYSLTSQ